MWLVVVIILLMILITFDFIRGMLSQPQPQSESIISFEGDIEVSVEDMVLHDIENQDDTFDIGVIDFNE